MEKQKSIASILIFVGSVLCFFLPFVTLSCGGMKVATLTGVQLSTGTMLAQSQGQKIDAEPSAAIAGLCALAGVGLSLVGRKMAGASAAAGGIGVLSMLVLHFRMVANVQKQGQGMITANSESGYTLALLLLIAGTAWNVYLFLQNRKAIPAPADWENPPVPADTGGERRFCEDCGKQIKPENQFCEGCGAPVSKE